MKTLIKTDKVIKVDPWSVINLRKFVKRYIRWEPEDYINGLNERLPDWISNYITVEIPLDTVILPSYVISPIPPVLKNIIKPNYSSIIHPDNFSYFDLYKVVDDPNGEIMNVSIGVGVDYRMFKDEMVRIQNMLLTFEYILLNYPKKAYLFINPMGIASEEDLIKALNSLKWAQGKSYSNFPRRDSKLIKKLLTLEEHLTLFLNFLYALHAYKFDDDGIASWLFKPYSDLVKGYGCDFEEALSIIEFASALLS
jgi:hypothetical protein